MLGTAIIVFREVIEAALVVSIVMAACRGLVGRGFWVGTGILGGLAGAGLAALFAGRLAQAAEGMGPELLNAGILLLAVAMLGWHNVWMARHGRELANQVREVSRAVLAGARPLYALAIVVGVAVLREGSETVLFVYSIATSEGADAAMMLTGGFIGLVLGAGLGAGLYFGLLRIPMRHLFTVTNALILMLAAGMAAQAADFLIQANVLPAWGEAVWDTSSILDERSIPGRVVHTLTGYVSQPTGMQVLFYAATLAIILLLMRTIGRNGQEAGKRPPGAAMHAAIGTLVAGVSLGAVATEASADFKVRSPIVEQGEIELEHNGSVTFDKSNSGKDNARSYTNSIGYGVTEFWKTELEGEWGADPGSTLRYSATTWENVFQLVAQGQYWADLGFFAEYSRAAIRGSADSVKFGPLVEKEWGDSLHTANLLFEKEVGQGRTERTGFSYAWQSRLRLHPLFEPGVELYGEVPDIHSPGKPADQQHRIGPVAAGLYDGLPFGKLKFEVGYLFGLTPATEKGAARWRLEYEFRF
ncbi:MAG: FTR1 family protein [Proteobacteria bacterium]|nr:FTR1 family protein [Pseudomonadota bacterium]MBI3499927.1 FTR1 family protein [Pseudomonadota bacterium]